ncbi:NAD(P)-dependent oxidoreductase [Synechococcus sp. CBW1004]|uniref:NAD-dependent epimerase/dehydratase family protein n=1 Tax=Synechococcus sp. CBW1004 TaxID=1353136 RepID=UPI001E4C64A4|nr:NAD-dependent epimerase/dehydratase family protein [Synechococcus sp. CBW1004]
MVGSPFQADNLYGWAKLIGEMTLAAYYKKYGMRSVACRYFTVYGPRCGESHAIMAMIGRALRREDPFIVWGNGEQVRNWTHVDDIVSGTLLAAERISDAHAINLGTMERIRVIDVARETLGYFGHDPVIKLLPHQPTGPLNRVADNSLAAKLLGWRPCVAFSNGLQETIEWRKACRLFNSC